MVLHEALLETLQPPTSQIPLPKTVPCLASAALAGPLEAVLGPTLSVVLSAVSFLGGRQPFGVRPFARSKAWPVFHACSRSQQDAQHLSLPDREVEGPLFLHFAVKGDVSQLLTCGLYK